MTALIAALTSAAVTGCSGESAAEGEPVPSLREAIRPAPAFALETLDGDSLTLASLAADHRAILINFWASWCEPCKAEIPDLMALHDAYGDRGFTVLGVTVNDLPRDSRQFARDMQMNYPLVIGTPAMLEEYRLSPWLPTTLLVVDEEVVEEWIGPRTRKEFEYPIRVALGLAPPVESVLEDTAPAGER
ncbi:MAG TPA: TlpA disulfide reductase family protein [Gemmatimonadota bacterium]|nr:TlpA disulfide reductase family protein [Gemmatimonadota bacterium]